MTKYSTRNRIHISICIKIGLTESSRKVKEQYTFIHFVKILKKCFFKNFQFEQNLFNVALQTFQNRGELKFMCFL